MELLLLKERQVCRRLNVSRTTLRKLMAQGKLRGCHIGRALRFHVLEVERFARELAEQAASDGH